NGTDPRGSVKNRRDPADKSPESVRKRGPLLLGSRGGCVRSMALKGDTSNLLLADIFQTLSQNGQLGLLHLTGEGVEHRILFSPRGITAVDARAFQAERLAEMLQKSGRVGKATLRKALTEAR